MKKTKVGLYIKLLGACALLLAVDILLILPSSSLNAAGIIALVVLAALTGLFSFLMVGEIRRSGVSSGDTGLDDNTDSYRRRLRSNIGWNIFHLTWLSAGLFVLIWVKVVMAMPDPELFGAKIPFAVFAGIVVFAVVYVLIRVFVNAGRLKKLKSAKAKPPVK